MKDQQDEATQKSTDPEPTYHRTAGQLQLRLGGAKRRSYWSGKTTKPPAGNQQITNGLQPASHPDLSRQRANRLNAVQPRMHMQKIKAKTAKHIDENTTDVKNPRCERPRCSLATSGPAARLHAPRANLPAELEKKGKPIEQKQLKMQLTPGHCGVLARGATSSTAANCGVLALQTATSSTATGGFHVRPQTGISRK